MFAQEFKVNGEIIKGQIKGNWSKNSQYAFHISTLTPQTLDEEELLALIKDLEGIHDKVVKLNNEFEESKLR